MDKKQKKKLGEEFDKAVKVGDEEAVRAMLNGPDRADLDGLGDKMLSVIKEGAPTMLKEFLDAGVYPAPTYYSSCHSEEKYPLRVAIVCDKIEMARILLKDDRTEHPDHQIPVYYAVEKGLDTSARALAKKFNRSTEWTELFELARARHFMKQLARYQEILEKAGEWKPDMAPGPARVLRLK